MITRAWMMRSSIISKYVKNSKPRKHSPAVWWNQVAYDAKLKLFSARFDKPTNYNAVVNHCRTVQSRAFATFQRELRVKLQGCTMI